MNLVILTTLKHEHCMHSNSNDILRSINTHSRSEKDKIYARMKTITSTKMTGELIIATNVFIIIKLSGKESNAFEDKLLV